MAVETAQRAALGKDYACSVSGEIDERQRRVATDGKAFVSTEPHFPNSETQILPLCLTGVACLVSITRFSLSISLQYGT